MLSSIDRIECLIVEDDLFKMEGIRAHLKEHFGNRIMMSECQALSVAKALLASKQFHLAIIDMSIHSHEPEKGAGSAFPLSSGGLDVLFQIVYSGRHTPCIVLTQYPDIEIEGEPVPVEMAQKEILEKFSIEVAGCVRYIENDNRWKAAVTSILERL
jgi:hypothetical protein